MVVAGQLQKVFKFRIRETKNLELENGQKKIGLSTRDSTLAQPPPASLLLRLLTLHTPGEADLRFKKS
jgi:hypothetical protein